MTMGCGGYRRDATITTLLPLIVRITRKHFRYLVASVPSITTPTNGGMCSRPPPRLPPWKSPAQKWTVVSMLRNRTKGVGTYFFNQSDFYMTVQLLINYTCTHAQSIHTHMHINVPCTYMYHAHATHTTHIHTPHTFTHHTHSHTTHIHTPHTFTHHAHTHHTPCTHASHTPHRQSSNEATLYMTKKAITTEIGSAFHEILEQFGRTRDIKEKERIGSDMTNVAIGHMIRGRLCSALAGLLLDGLKPYRMEGLVVDDIWKVTVAFCQEGGPCTHMYTVGHMTGV